MSRFVVYATIASILILASISMAEVKPQLVSEMDSTVFISGKLEVMGSVNSIDLNLTIPQNTSYQVVRCNASTITRNGVKMASLHYSSPSGTIHYNVVCHVHTTAQIIKSVPSSYDVSPYIEYTKPSEGVPSNDPEIRSLAQNITAGETDDFKKLARLMQWVHNYIVYDESYAGKYLDAKTILRVRHGVCVEYSTLFVTLARSLGYPARFVGGIAYGDKGPTGHMWVEVYVGRGIPFDPTWDLGGSLDATHIPFYKSVDRKFDSTIRYIGTGGTVRWISEGGGGEYFSSGLGSVHVENMVQENPPVKLEKISPASLVGFSSGTFVGANLTADRFLIIPITLTTCTSNPPVADVENPTKTVIIEPGLHTLVYWGVKTFSLDPRYIYTCPLVVNSDFIDTTHIDIKVRKTKTPKLSVYVSNRRPKLGGDIYVYLNSDTPTLFYGVYDNQFGRDSGTSGMIKFKANHLGTQKLMITTSKGGLWEYGINTTLGGSIYIDNIEYPQAVLEGSKAIFEIDVVNKAEKDVPVTISINDGYSKKSVVIPIRDRKTVNFTLEAKNPGPRTVSITAEGGESFDSRVVVMKVIQKPDVNVSVSVGKNGLMTADLTKIGDPKDIRIIINGRSFSGVNKITDRLPPGEYVMQVFWSDELGNDYSKKITVTVPHYGGNTDVFVLIFIALLAITMGLIIAVIYMIVKNMPKKIEE